MVISLVNQKGGVGKTTISINLSHCIAASGSKTLLIDGDDQGSCLLWKSLRESTSFDIVHYPKKTINRDIKSLGKGYKHIIIDAGPGVSDTTLSILLCSNMVIVPCAPSILDIWAGNSIIDLIRDARKHNRRLKGRLLISRLHTGTVPAREIRGALAAHGLDIFQTVISERIAFVRSMIEGQSVLEYAPSSDATIEIKNLYDEIFGG